jgi:hypothetical protein
MAADPDDEPAGQLATGDDVGETTEVIDRVADPCPAAEGSDVQHQGVDGDPQPGRTATAMVEGAAAEGAETGAAQTGAADAGDSESSGS